MVFSGYSVSSTNKSDRYDATEILLKVVLNIIHINPNLSDRNICIETLLFKIIIFEKKNIHIIHDIVYSPDFLKYNNTLFLLGETDQKLLYGA